MDHAPYRLAEQLEWQLGDPDLPETVFGHDACLALDEREEFPAAICERLEQLGLHEYYVPAEYGGRLQNYEQVLQQMRTVARRDLTVAIGHGKTYLGGVCVWVSGTEEQGRRLGEAIRAGLPVSLGLTERAHGSDLLANEVCAEPTPDGGWSVAGEKWLINNATRGSIISLLTRTDPDGGPRAYSVLLVDKRALPQESYRCLEKIRTHGIRGADISGIAFSGATVPGDAVVGTVGGGVETVLKALQLTRTMCAALSLGAADHALRLGLDFATERTLYGRALVELPQARRTLAECAADVLAGEALTLVASRAVHTAPAELSITAAVTKYLVPTRTEAVIASLTRLLGARAFLKGVFAGGQFQKVDRDHRIVGLFDGNTLVNLNSLVSQFRSLARAHRRGTGDVTGAVRAFRLAEPLPPFAPERLSLVARHGSGVFAALPGSVEQLRRAAAEDPAFKPALQAAERLLTAVDQVHEELAEHQNTVTDVPPAAFDAARRFSLCFAAAACVGLWAHTRAEAETGATAELWRGALWLRAALARLLTALGLPDTDDPQALDEVLDVVRAQHADGRLVSLLSLSLHPNHAVDAAGNTMEEAS
ncbi:acyl-CoA dehydrogenase family protein [Streptacidiphilus jiangxiensis]|uniref:Acyl-CoA dehydrogenase n=1 Tax=Streptacidiphilus jiangxiensis TaxID=235985 RepID=A0A1H7I9D7_STRJI|nr:acyl-CoA dehydrogenase family protein [Streptacidiphilus jiangxiensis]SEK58954.1 Acyl-CoA dehydrogenase [Streptacidiphilus jiangxiensis]